MTGQLYDDNVGFRENVSWEFGEVPLTVNWDMLTFELERTKKLNESGPQ